MTGEIVQNRNILESKDKTELQTIAEAMSLKVNSRTKKSDMIDLILSGSPITSETSYVNGGSSTPSSISSSLENGGSTPIENQNGSGNKPNNSGQVDNGKVNSGHVNSGDSPSKDMKPKTPRVNAALIKFADEGSSGLDDAGEEGVKQSQGELTYTPRAEGKERDGMKSESNEGRAESQSAHSDNNSRRNRRRRGKERGPRPERDQNQEPNFDGEPIPIAGLLDLRDEGYGFIRGIGYLPSNKDVYVSLSQARRFSLRKGDHIEGFSRPAASNEKYPALLKIETINGLAAEEAKHRPKFEDLTPLFPDEKLRLEIPGVKDNMTARIVDLLSPIGKGQRGLIVSPPKAGKTTVMKQIAYSIEENNPGVHLMVLLVDERPEEVTDMRRSVKGEVIASTFDRPSEEHTMVAELAIERAKRLVELKKDVVIILDGITRLARAYNLAQPTSGRVMSGGVDSGALYPPKKFFGAARNTEEGGSLTILATALVETGSKMDEVIFEEFKGTGNMELRLDRRLAERRIYPAIDVNASSTRHEELLFERIQLQQVWKLRRVLNALAQDGNAAPGLELLMDKIKSTVSNDEFLAEIAKNPSSTV